MNKTVDRQVVVSNGASNMTGVAVVTSDPVSIQALAGISFQAVWTGTPTGTFSFEVSNNYDQQNPGLASAKWTVVSSSFFSNLSNVQPAGGAGDAVIELRGMKVKWVRLKYTNSAGAGSLDVWAHGKQAGG
ncbi:MAG TPA: hypothetical protein VFJ24_07145 [Gaiellales bacterium]|nr:hypothetical protein [Gaiellales bacterium]